MCRLCRMWTELKAIGNSCHVASSRSNCGSGSQRCNGACHLRPRQVNKSLRSKQQIANKKPFNINIQYSLAFFQSSWQVSSCNHKKNAVSAPFPFPSFPSPFCHKTFNFSPAKRMRHFVRLPYFARVAFPLLPSGHVSVSYSLPTVCSTCSKITYELSSKAKKKEKEKERERKNELILTL